MKSSDWVLILPKVMEKDLYKGEVIMSVSQHELNVRKITKGGLILLGMDEHNTSNQLHFVNDILTSKDFPEGVIADGQCIIHVESLPNTIVQNRCVTHDEPRKKRAIWNYIVPLTKDKDLTAILVYDLKVKQYRWVGHPHDAFRANSLLKFFQRNISRDLFEDFIDHHGAIWLTEYPI